MLTQATPLFISRRNRRRIRGMAPVAMAIVLVVLCSGCSRTGLYLRSSSSSADWPTARGAADNRGVAAGGSVVVDQLLWRSRTGGEAAGEPTVRGGLLYYPGLDRRLEVFAVSDGQRLFRTRFDGPVSGVLPTDSGFDVVTDQDEQRYLIYRLGPLRQVAAFPIPSCRAAPRLLDDSLILLGAWNGTLWCFNRNGDSLWSAQTEGPIFSTPAVADSTVYVASGRQVVAMTCRDGRRLWSHRATGAIVAAPAVGDQVYVGSADSLVYALDRQTGSMDWFFAAAGGVFTTPAVGPDRVFFGANDGAIYALDKSTGRLLWRYDTGAIANLSCTLAGTAVLVSSRRGRLLLLNAADGVLVNEHRLDAPAATSPIVAGGRVFVADTKRNLYCFGPAADSPTVH